ncbi:cysteine-rich venom protein [Elysia marginata]|uniref:Cysteine-rich venom protein n=1 Tax=Elysia marginata TaxID=1093978 RepID=A0AAV4H5U1_9GAST|nr:cysteine-rich venom protein [Elysia marginata]
MDVYLNIPLDKSGNFYGLNPAQEHLDKCECNPSLSCDPKYQRVAGHTACLSRAPTTVPGVLDQAQKDAIVAQHNRLRGLVDPVAINMLKMSWDDEVAMLAQKWAEACDLDTSNRLHHDKYRNIPGRFSVGQNIGTGYANFTEATDAWFDEKDNYKPLFGTSVRSVAGSKPIGHYTQEFKEGKESHSNCPRPGRPKSCLNEQTVASIKKDIDEDPHVSVRELSDTNGLSYGAFHTIITEHLPMKKVKSAVNEQRPKASTRSLLLHDNAGSHKARATSQSLRKLGIQVLPHPAYSPDLAPCDFWLFSRDRLAGRKFDRIQDLAKAVNSELRTIPEEGFQGVFQK